MTVCEVTKLRVPSSSFGPQRPQFLQLSASSFTSARVANFDPPMTVFVVGCFDRFAFVDTLLLLPSHLIYPRAGHFPPEK